MSPARAAIHESVMHGQIVTIEGDSETCTELLRLCDDSVKCSYDRGAGEEPGLLVEYWGRDWRVHVEVAS